MGATNSASKTAPLTANSDTQAPGSPWAQISAFAQVATRPRLASLGNCRTALSESALNWHGGPLVHQSFQRHAHIHHQHTQHIPTANEKGFDWITYAAPYCSH